MEVSSMRPTKNMEELLKRAEKAGRILNRLRWETNSVEKTCLMCGKTFRALYWAKFCSDACRKRYHRRLKRMKKLGLGIEPNPTTGGDEEC